MGVVETITRNLNEINNNNSLVISLSTYAYSCDRLVDLWGELGTQEGKGYRIGRGSYRSAVLMLIHIFAIASPYAKEQSCTEEKLPGVAKYSPVDDTGVILVLSLRT